MYRVVAILVAALAPLGVLAQEDSASKTVIGPENVFLADGARAIQTGDYALGVDLTLKGLKLNPRAKQRVAALSNVCAGYIGLKLYHDAKSYCDAAIEINPNFWRAYNNRAVLLLRTGNTLAAIEVLKQGLEIRPGSPTLIRALEIAEATQRKPRVLIEDH